MAVYKSYIELENNILQLNDIIYFNGIKYYVSHTHLSFVIEKGQLLRNDHIFNILNIKNKVEFCSKHYGYPSTNGSFPSAKINDYKALTRIALGIFNEFEISYKSLSQFCKE